MSKAVMGAALLTVAGVALAAGTGGLGDAALVFVQSTMMSIAGTSIAAVSAAALGTMAATGLALEVGALAGELSQGGMPVTSRQTASPRQVIYGQQRIGGVEIYRSTTGAKRDQMNYIIVLAGHPCDSVANLYLDGRQVFWEVGSAGNSTSPSGVNFGGNADSGLYMGPNGVTYTFENSVYCEAYLGNQIDAPNTTPNGGYSTGLQANDPTWAADKNGNLPWVAGCTYVYLKIEYNTEMFPAEPEIRFTVNGKNTIYDPRTNTSGFTTNWALIAADVINDPMFGLNDNSVNQAQLIAAANVCDEQVMVGATGTTESRYTTNYHYDTTSSPGNIIDTMMKGAAGRLSRIGGEWFIWPAYWQGPSFQFDENSLLGPMKWEPYRSFSDLINCVNGTYIAPTYPYSTSNSVTSNLYDPNGYYNGQIQNNFPFAFQPTNYPQYAADTLHGYAANQYLIEDGGQTLPLEMALATVLSVTQAQRVAKISLMRNRQQGSGTFQMNLAAWAMQPLDVMQFTFAQNGWTEKNLEIVGVSFNISDQSGGGGVPSIRCTMKVQETDPTVYEWSTTEELTVYDVPATPTQNTYTPTPPTDMTLTSGVGTAIIALDGTITPRIEVQWNTPADVLTTQIQVQYQLVGATAWLNAGLVDVSLNVSYITGVVSGQQYNVQIRGLRPNGVASPWVAINGYIVSTTLSVMGILALDPGSLVAEAYTDGTASIEVSGFTAVIGNASVAVLPAGPVTLTGLQQQVLYYVYYIDLNFTGGAITPIATTNSSDFVNKTGYFLIDSVVTPYAASSGGSGGTGTGARYYPSSASDIGTRTTTNPGYAFDGSLSSYAVVSANITISTVSSGNCVFQGDPSIALATVSTLTVLATISMTGATAIADGSVEIVATVGGVLTTMTPTTTVSSIPAYTLSIPANTPLNTISVSVQADINAAPHAGSGDTIGTVSANVYEIYIQS